MKINIRQIIRKYIKEALGTKTILPPDGLEFDPMLAHLSRGGVANDKNRRPIDIDSIKKSNDSFLAAWDKQQSDHEELGKKRKRSEELLAQLRAQDKKEDEKNAVDSNAETVPPGKLEETILKIVESVLKESDFDQFSYQKNLRLKKELETAMDLITFYLKENEKDKNVLVKALQRIKIAFQILDR